MDATPDCTIDTSKLFYRPVIIFFRVCETNKNVRHEHDLLPNSIYEDFTVEEVEAVIAIMIRSGLDRVTSPIYLVCRILMTAGHFIT